MPRRTLSVARDLLRLAEPFRIAGHVFDDWEVVQVTIVDGTRRGQGEGGGVFFLGEHGEEMEAAIEAVRREVEAGVGREELRSILPPGGARNAVDAALWDLEAATTGSPVWKLAGIAAPRPIVTTFTLGADAPARMASAARARSDIRAITVKLTGELAVDIDRVRAIRAARPDVWLGVDGNQGFDRSQLDELIPALTAQRVSLLEQPLPRTADASLEELSSPIPIAGDESILSLDDLASAPGRFQVINIKLDKCGGLTEGLLMEAEARRLGLGVMVGTMICSSLGAAPGFLLGQLGDFVDLDGPSLLAEDRSPSVVYRDGTVFADEEVWGGPRS
ncbi:dipeptide epimerase [Streptosporangium sp. NPDC006013]|uniref:dipeptide epimerase n=1 Tax=Streptosporangium sp. NPDC006013 TaxID=3155596 RepID=UPI0033BD7338